MIDGFNNVQFCMRFNKSDINTTVIEHSEPPKLTDVLEKLHGGDSQEVTTTPAVVIGPNKLMLVFNDKSMVVK